MATWPGLGKIDTCIPFISFLQFEQANDHSYGLMSEVHESDLTENYDLLKEYLLAFAGSKLPSAKDQKASWQHPQASM